MRIAVLGTGAVGRTIATKLVELGHEVTMGSRTANNENAREWVAAAGAGAAQGTFANAAAGAELVFNCTGGAVAVEVLRAAGAANLAGKVVVDVSNPLDFSHGRPTTLSICNTDSVGEQLQREFPDARIVKNLNTVNQAVIFVGGLAVDALAVEAREKGRRASPIKTLVVVEHANPQSAQLLALESGKTGKLSIMRAADCVKERGRSAV